jgi:type I restriction enzyme S subunit
LDGKERCIDDEIPFEIPENWAWTRLNNLCFSIADGDHQPPPQEAEGIPFLVISNVSSGHLVFTNVRHVPQKYYDELSDSRKPEIGDLLFTVTGSFGIVVPIENEVDFCFQRHMALLKKPKCLSSTWLASWLQSPMIYDKCNSEATGTAQKTVGLNTLRNLILPVPPLAEQARIIHQLSLVMQKLTNQ